jgi:hypothetical protein
MPKLDELVLENVKQRLFTPASGKSKRFCRKMALRAGIEPAFAA